MCSFFFFLRCRAVIGSVVVVWKYELFRSSKNNCLGKPMTAMCLVVNGSEGGSQGASHQAAALVQGVSHDQFSEPKKLDNENWTWLA